MISISDMKKILGGEAKQNPEKSKQIMLRNKYENYRRQNMRCTTIIFS